VPSTHAHPCLGREGIVVDPNATLTAIRELVIKTYTDEGARTGDLAHLVDLVEALDAWLSKGGFVPAAWDSTRAPLGELTANDHILTRAGIDLDSPGIPYALGTFLQVFPDTPIFVRVKKTEQRAVVQFGYSHAEIALHLNAVDVNRLATLFGHVRNRLT
jgi:hypothetical protein